MKHCLHCRCHVTRARSWIEVGVFKPAGPREPAADPVRHPRGFWGLYLSGAGQHWKPGASRPPVVRFCVRHVVVFS